MFKDQQDQGSTTNDCWSVASEPESCQHELYFDCYKKSDRNKLKYWCELHWNTTFQRSLWHNNYLEYNSCCNSFSRRAFYKKAGHPRGESFHVPKLFKSNYITSSYDLYKWLLGRAITQAENWKKVFFPSDHRSHDETQQIHARNEQESAEESLLGKRKKEQDILMDTLRKLSEAENEKQRLLASTLNWYNKYHETIIKLEVEELGKWSPHKKNKLIDDFELLI